MVGPEAARPVPARAWVRAAAIAGLLLALLPAAAPAESVTVLSGEDEPGGGVVVEAGEDAMVRLFADASVPAGETFPGDVVAVFGSVDVGGTVQGDVVAVLGSVRLRPGAKVVGDAVAVGGGLEQPAGAADHGRQPAPVDFEVEADELADRVGIIANGLVEKIGVEYIGNQIFLNSILGSGVAGIVGFVAFGGLKLFGKKVDPDVQARVSAIVNAPIEPWNRNQLITLGAIAAWIILVLVFKFDVGYTALTLAVLLSFVGAADEKEAMAKQPWFTMFMLVGVMVLVEVAGKTGGLEYAINAIASVSSVHTISSVFGFINGFVSIYSGSSTVVMPTFIPLIPGLVAKLGVTGADAIDMIRNLIYTCCVSAHLVDASPLSLLGALCIAAAPEWDDKNKLFRNLLFWGMGMSVFAAVISFVFWR